jgi:hypothetical protein
MAQIIAALIPLVLLGFWAWMCRDMTRNSDLPNCFFTITRWSNPKSDWTAAFLLLNIFTAVHYFVNVYRYRRLP